MMTKRGLEHPILLSDLAHVYMAMERYMEAEPLLKRVLEYEEKTFGPNSFYAGEAASGLAVLYWKQRRYTEAQLLFDRAVSIMEANEQYSVTYLVPLLTSLTAFYIEQGARDKALASARRASDIVTRKMEWPDEQPGSARPDLVETIFGLGHSVRTKIPLTLLYQPGCGGGARTSRTAGATDPGDLRRCPVDRSNPSW